MISDKVVTNIEKIRKSREITKTELAKRIGISLQGYRHIINGTVRLDVSRVEELAAALNVEATIFFNDELTDTVINRQNGGTKTL